MEFTVEAYLRLKQERQARDSVQRAGLTPYTVARVYQALAQLALADGRVDADERAHLEAFRERFGLSREVGEGLEEAARAAHGRWRGLHLPELSLLLDEVQALVRRRRQPVRSEQLLLERLSRLLTAHVSTAAG